MKYRALIIVLQLFIVTASAQDIVRPIRLKSGLVMKARNLRNVIQIADSLKPVHYRNRFYTIIQFSKIPDMATRQALAREGIALFDYIPDNTFLAEINDRFSPAQLRKDIISGIFTFEPKTKISAKLERLLQQPIPDPDKLIAVSFYGNIDRNTAITALREAGAQIADTKIQPDRIVFINAPAAVVQKIARLPFVAYISSQQIKNEAINYNDRAVHAVNALGVTTGRNLKGKNVTLGIGDNGEISTHLDFSGRLINRNPAAPAHHGIHTAGTMAGAGLINPLRTGMAPKATIVAQLYSDILVNTPYYITDFNMVLSNNSYHAAVAGCAGESEYDALSYYVDAQLNANPQLLHVFAVGNDGGRTCTPFPGSYATVKSGFQCGKNVLSVGALDQENYNIAGFSSRGPVSDGRLKPEIVAAGFGVASTTLNNGYTGDWGTSMASPVVTGVLGLLYERYRQLHSNTDPAAALIKAIACNSAEDLGAPGPDFTFGFGFLNARRAVEAIENNTYFANSVGQGGAVTHTITGVPAGTAQLKVMLYWNDPAAAPFAATTLVNNLDITVTTPGGTIRYPMILNPAPANVMNAATEGVDSRNNIEQVVINTPAAGNYTITVNGTAVPAGPQDYVVAYQLLPDSVTLEHPYGGDNFVSGETENIRWAVPPGNTNNFTLEYSLDNGSTWNLIDGNIPATSRMYSWVVPNLPTGAGLVRVSMNSTGYSDETDYNITISRQPVISVTNTCPGYASLLWNTIEGATSYDILMVKNGDMEMIGNTTDTFYLQGGLRTDNAYWFTVRPVLGTLAGRRGLAGSVIPSGGACASATYDHDFRAELLASPVTGRMFTASQLGSAAPQVTIKNLGTVASSGSFDITYQVNGGTPVTENSTQNIAANGIYTYTFSSPYDFSAPGTYTVRAWITYSNDTQHGNDTVVSVVKQLQNTAIDLSPSFTEGFESAAAGTYVNGTRGFDGLDRCDFYSNNANGRARTFVNTGIARSGIRAVTLDQTVNSSTASADSLITTFNLGNYLPTSQIWLSFYYKNQGIDFSLPGNRVWIRGSENDAWIPVTTLNINAAGFGNYQSGPQINVTEALANAFPAQYVSSSFQIKFGENGYRSTNSVIPNGNADDGYTFDDITLTLASNDLAMSQIITPIVNNVCSLGPVEQIMVQVRNYSSSVMNNVPVRYNINGTTVSETIPTINAGETLNYTFTTTADLSAYREYTLTAWVDLPSDDYSINDTISLTFQTTPYIDSYPYVQGFETDNGGWYTGGINNSWEWGTPVGAVINKAANGSKAWVTDTAGNHNHNEISYLYSPCFNLSGLSNPVLSFSHIFRTEDNCDCDFHWVEYSTNGVNWILLGQEGMGTNWYDHPWYQAWKTSSTRWHVSSIDIPTRNVKVRFRFVMHTDPAVSYEGVGIDDIHIFDKNWTSIYNGPDITSGLSQPVSGNDWIHFDSDGKRVVSIHPNGQDLGNTNVKLFINTGSVRDDNNQYYLDRNMVIQPANTPSNPVTVRYYFMDIEANALINATGCTYCSTISDAYEAGITQYSNAPLEENGTLSDNHNGVYQYITPAQVIVMPYDSGYYAEYQVSHFSEFWINSGGPGQNQALPQILNAFTATRITTTGLLQWSTLQESNTDQFIIERSDDGIHYKVIGTLPASGNSNAIKRYTFVDEQLLTGKNYYRLKMTDIDGKFTYSPVRTISNSGVDLTVNLHPNPVTKDILFVNTSANCTRLELRDVAGRLLKAVTVKGMQNQLPMQDVARGIYFLTIYTDAGQKMEKVFVE